MARTSGAGQVWEIASEPGRDAEERALAFEGHRARENGEEAVSGKREVQARDAMEPALVKREVRARDVVERAWAK